MKSEYKYYKQSYLKLTLLNKILLPILILLILGMIYIATQLLLILHKQLPYILILLLILALYLRSSYIKYLQKSFDLKTILKNYKHDERSGILIHKKTKKPFCFNCLYSEPHLEAPLTITKSGWQCQIKDCHKFYRNPDYKQPPPKARDTSLPSIWNI